MSLLPADYSFSKFLAAKRSVDDRALNHAVRLALAHELRAAGPDTVLSVLEIGAGTGAMIERMLTWEIFCNVDWTAMDLSADHLAEARQRLPEWAAGHGYGCLQDGDSLVFANGRQTIRLHLKQADIYGDLKHALGKHSFDLLVAHAFMDLVDIPTVLPELFHLLTPGGLFYFTINFDGETILEPVVDPAFDRLVMQLYHDSMDARIIAGRHSGDSRTGRRLFGHLTAAGAQILAAGASDWIVFPQTSAANVAGAALVAGTATNGGALQGGAPSPIHGVYPADEGYFLHHIIHTIQQALDGHPDLDPSRFQRWVAARHAQVESGRLIYIAHQLDFIGRTAAAH